MDRVDFNFAPTDLAGLSKWNSRYTAWRHWCDRATASTHEAAFTAKINGEHMRSTEVVSRQKKGIDHDMVEG